MRRLPSMVSLPSVLFSLSKASFSSEGLSDMEYSLPCPISVLGIESVCRYAFPVILSWDWTGHLNQSKFLKEVLDTVSSCIRPFSVPDAIVDDCSVGRLNHFSEEMLTKEGKLRVASSGRLFNVKLLTDWRDSEERARSLLAPWTSMFPETMVRIPSSDITSGAEAAMTMLPVNVSHVFISVTSFSVLTSKVPEAGAQSGRMLMVVHGRAPK